MNMRPQPSAFIAVTPTMRVLIENVIEDLMLQLDEIDGDADLEDGGDTENDCTSRASHRT
jgi:hypothetical protein